MEHSPQGPGSAQHTAHLLRISRIWFAVGVLVLVVNGLIAAWSFREIDAADYWVAHTHQVIEQTAQLQFAVTNANAFERTYILKPTPTARAEFDEATQEIPAQFAAVKNLTWDNDSQQQRLATIAPLLRERSTELASEIDLLDRSGPDASEKLRVENQLKRTSWLILTACEAIKAEEMHLLAQREETRRRRKYEALAGMAVSSVFILIALLIGPFAVNSSVKRLMEADRSLEASAAELRRLAGQLITSQEDERRRIARNLHDDLSQSLAYLSMDLGRIAEKPTDPALPERLLRLKEKAADTANLVRSISHQLHPSTLDDLGISVALEEYCTEFEERTGIATSLEFRNIENLADIEVAKCVYFVVAESLRNVGKHSGASKASVKLDADASGLRATVSDDGVGIDKNATGDHSGIGMTIMRERLHLVRGTMSIRSPESGGTVIEFLIPLSSAKRS